MTDYITKPFTVHELHAAVDEHDCITTVIKVDWGTLVSNDFEQNLDMFSEAVIGDTLLTDVSYELVGVHEDGSALVRVTGEVSFEYMDAE